MEASKKNCRIANYLETQAQNLLPEFDNIRVCWLAFSNCAPGLMSLIGEFFYRLFDLCQLSGIENLLQVSNGRLNWSFTDRA